jgi:hypothetical protein
LEADEPLVALASDHMADTFLAYAVHRVLSSLTFLAVVVVFDFRISMIVLDAYQILVY